MKKPILVRYNLSMSSLLLNVLMLVASTAHGPTGSSSFYSAPQCSHCKRCTSYSNFVRLSIRLSVRPSHASTVSKRLHVARGSLHCQIAKCVQFSIETKKYSRGMIPSPKTLAQSDSSLQEVVSFDTFCLVARQR